LTGAAEWAKFNETLTPGEARMPEAGPADTVLRSTRVLTPDGERPATVFVGGGRITAVGPHDAEVPAAARLVDVGSNALLPGLVDTHVHINDPGRTHWEGFETATRAAAAGGVTTVVDMPLNSVPPTTSTRHLELKRDTARGRVHVDTGFWGGAVPGNTGDLLPLHQAGVFGFKCFLLHSGVDEFPHLGPAELADAMAEIARFDGLLIVHAEDPHLIDGAPQPRGRRYADFLASRPRTAENTAIAGLIDLAKRFGCRVHILHLSSAWLSALGTFDLVALENGGRAEDASDRFYSPPVNTIVPGRSTKMDEGWETRRRRDKGNDWIAYRLVEQGLIRAVEIDTGYYKGNAAGWVSLSARNGGDGDGDGEWSEILPRTRLQPDTVHRFLVDAAPATHVRLDIFPDGGIARLRLHGSLTDEGARRLTRRWTALGGTP
jgi:hypothetical protein